MDAIKLSKRLNITNLQALRVLSVIRGKTTPLRYKSVRSWVDQCYNMPNKVELKLCALNEIIEGYGVEYIEHKDDSFHEVYGLDYVNLGDTYTNTVMFDHFSNKWRYRSYGDIVGARKNYI